MDAVCVFVAGALAATLSGPEFTLSWTHSVQKMRWEERYRVDGAALRLVEASVEGSGAGMDPPDGSSFADGRWRWRPDRTIPELALRRSGFAGDYSVCGDGRCAPMSQIAGPATLDAVAVVKPCAAAR